MPYKPKTDVSKIASDTEDSTSQNVLKNIKTRLHFISQKKGDYFDYHLNW